MKTLLLTLGMGLALATAAQGEQPIEARATDHIPFAYHRSTVSPQNLSPEQICNVQVTVYVNHAYTNWVSEVYGRVYDEGVAATIQTTYANSCLEDVKKYRGAGISDEVISRGLTGALTDSGYNGNTRRLPGATYMRLVTNMRTLESQLLSPKK